MSWKSHPYDASGILYLLQPDVVLKARVNLADASYPVAVIPYDGVSEGSIDDVRMGMTVLIGSSDGAWDRGCIYVRADADGVIGGLTTINIGYCSRGSRRGEVELVNDSYITVLDTYDVWKRASRFVEGEGNYKDYELDGLDPLPVAQLGGIGGLASMGIVSGGVLTLSFDSSGAYATAPGAALAATAWDVGDGTITVGSDTDAAITATFPAGKRWIRLLKQQVDTRYSLPRMHLVVALASESSGVQTMHRARLRLTPEGATFNCDVKERLNPANYPPGTIAIWWVRERYAGVEGSVTGYAVKFAGYVTGMQGYGRGTRTGWERGTTLTAVDVAGRMAMVRANASSLMREDTVTNSNQVVGANLDRYAWWLLSWHTTVPLLTDFTWRGVDHPFTAFSSAGGDFYRAVDGVCRAAGMRLTMDSRGRLAMVDDPLLRDEGERTDTVLQTLAPGDITRIDRVAKPYPAVGMMRATAALESTIPASYYDDDAHDAPPEVHGKAPGDVDGQGAGTAQNGEPWLVPHVSALYARLGHALKRQNGDEDALKIALAHGGDGGIEPARMAWVEVSTDDDTVGWGDPALTDERCLVLATEYQFDDAAGTMRQTITVERETFGTPGVRDDVAGPDTQQPYDEGGAYPLPTGAVPTKLVSLDYGSATFARARSWNPTTGDVDWENASTGLDGDCGIHSSADPQDNRRKFVIAKGADGGLFRCDDVWAASPSWSLVASNATIFGSSSAVGRKIIMSINRPGFIAITTGAYGIVSSLDYGSTWRRRTIYGGDFDVDVAYGTDFSPTYVDLAMSSRNSGEEGWGYAIAGFYGNAVFKTEDWCDSFALTSATPDFGGRGQINVPYMRADEVTPNTNDAAQEVIILGGTGHSGNIGVVMQSEDAGESFVTKWVQNAGGINVPAGVDFGSSLNTWTYSGAEVIGGLLRTGAGGNNAGAFMLNFLTDIADPGDPLPVNYNMGGDNFAAHVNGFPTSRAFLLSWIHSDPVIQYTVDRGVTVGTLSFPAFFANTVGAADVQWDLSDFVPPVAS